MTWFGILGKNDCSVHSAPGEREARWESVRFSSEPVDLRCVSLISQKKKKVSAMLRTFGEYPKSTEQKLELCHGEFGVKVFTLDLG